MELISVKALSEELKVSKPTLFSRIDKLNLRSELQKQGRALMIPYEVAEKLRASFQGAQKEEQKAEQPAEESEELTMAIIELLREQLKSKDEIINRLQNQIDNLQEDNRRYIQLNSQLLLSGSATPASKSEAVEAEFTEEPEAERTEEEPKSEHKKSFLRRLFNM